MKHPVAVTANKKHVYARLIQSKIADKISREPHLMTLASEILEQQTLVAKEPVLEVDTKRTIGSTEVIETKETDNVFYAKKRKSDVYTRFVKHCKVQDTSIISMYLARDEDGDYELVDINPGLFVPELPGSPDESKESTSFWQKHAVVMNGQAIQSKTVTTDCPY